MRYQHRPQFLQSFLVAFPYRSRDLRGVNAKFVVRQAAHVREMLQVARTDASVFDHDVPISLLGYDRQSIARFRGGKVGHDVRARRLVNASGMQAEASQQAGSAQAALLPTAYIDDPAGLPTGMGTRQMLFGLSGYAQKRA